MKTKISVLFLALLVGMTGIVTPTMAITEDDIWQKVFSDSGNDKIAVMSEFKGDLYAGVGISNGNQAKILGLINAGCQNWIDVTPSWLSDTSAYIMSMLVFKDNLYVGTDKGQIFRTNDGANWEEVTGNLQGGYILDMVELQGQLYITNGGIYRLTDDTTLPATWEYISEPIKPTYTQGQGANPPSIESLEVFKDKLYAGVGLDNNNGIEIWRTVDTDAAKAGNTWEKFYEKKPSGGLSAGLNPGHVHAMKSFEDYLYVGEYHGHGIHITDGVTWEYIEAIKSGDIFRLEEHKDNLYLGAWATSTDASLYYSEDGTSWTPISGFRDIFSITSYGNNSYIGTNEFTDGKVYGVIYQSGSAPKCGDWKTEFVESPGWLGGQYSSIAIDSLGDQHMSFYGNSEMSLTYVRRSLRIWGGMGFIGKPPIWSSNWCSQCTYPINVGSSSIDNGEYTSIAIDSSDNSHISYYDRTNGDLKYAKETTNGWAIETVDSTGDLGEYTSIALDSSNNPHISYYDRTNGDLKYAKWNDNKWNIETVDSTENVGEYSSIDLDSSNNPHISYYDRTNGDLKYAKWNGNGWSIETVDTIRDVGEYSSIDLDSSNNPHISYYDRTNGDLKYVNNWNGKWFIEILDSKGNVGEYTSIAIDSLNYPHISYYDRTNGNLKYTEWWLTDWYIEIVDSMGNVGEYTSIVLDSSDHPHISYYDRGHNNLKYAEKNI